MNLWESSHRPALNQQQHFRIGGVRPISPTAGWRNASIFCELLRAKNRMIREADHQQSDLKNAALRFWGVISREMAITGAFRADAARLWSALGICARWITTSGYDDFSSGTWLPPEKGDCYAAIGCGSRKCASR